MVDLIYAGCEPLMAMKNLNLGLSSWKCEKILGRKKLPVLTDKLKKILKADSQKMTLQLPV